MRSLRFGHGGGNHSSADFSAVLGNATSKAMAACCATRVVDGSNHLERPKHDALPATQNIPRQC